MIEEIPIIEDLEQILRRNTVDFLKKKTVILYYMLRADRRQKGLAYNEKDTDKIFF